MTTKIIDGSILNVKPACNSVASWLQLSVEELRKKVSSSHIENYLQDNELSAAVSSVLGMKLPERMSQGKIEKDDDLIVVVQSDNAISFYKLTFKKVS